MGSTNGRYGTLGGRSERYAHRLAYAAFHGKPGDKVVCHRCDNPLCCNPEHLFLGTQRDNLLDALSKGRMKAPVALSGEAHPNAKLTEAQVAEIKRRVLLGEAKTHISKDFGVSDVVIGRIARGTMWK